jgi:mannose-6-phosphate isomerase-like protein (cupin superfamily)
MAVVLEGGCRVSEMNEGQPESVGTIKVWRQVGRNTGANAISLRVWEFAPGTSPPIKNDGSDEVFYALESISTAVGFQSEFTVEVDEQAYGACAKSGFYIGPGQTVVVKNPGPEHVVLVSARCPDEESVDFDQGTRGRVRSEREFQLVKLADKTAIPTRDRWYRVLVDDEVGSEQVTQFVGSIPPGRAPDHFHQYEEVLFILRGEGRMWAGETSTPIGPGSCIYLPRTQVHCVENTGTDELRLLGVFYPAGSPSVRYEKEDL